MKSKPNSTKPHVNSKGASYFASNAFGWATARTPWEAMAKLDLNLSRRAPSLTSKAFVAASSYVSLWYLPDEDKFKGTNNYAPIDAAGKVYGIPLYASTSEHNETVVFNALTHTPEPTP